MCWIDSCEKVQHPVEIGRSLKEMLGCFLDCSDLLRCHSTVSDSIGVSVEHASTLLRNRLLTRNIWALLLLDILCQWKEVDIFSSTCEELDRYEGLGHFGHVVPVAFEGCIE